MNPLVEKAKALRAQMLASVAPSEAGRKTLKGQRAAKAKVAKGKVAKAIKSVAASVREDMASVAGWTPPVSFSQWLKWHKTEVVDAVLKVNGTVSDWGRTGWNAVASLHADVLLAQASLRREYQRYVNATFSQAISFFNDGNAFAKIVRREEWLERQGKHDLGLLGYSAIDRVQIAVHYAWVKNVIRYLAHTGAYTPVAHFIPGYNPEKENPLTKEEQKLLTKVQKNAIKEAKKAANLASGKAYLDELGQALRDLRTDDELRLLAQLDGRSRYTVSGIHKDGSPRVRKQDQTEEVTIAVRWLELRAEFNAMPVAEYAKAALNAVYEKDASSVSYEVSSFIPSVGDVYQQLFAVTKEGMRQFRNTLEGLTQDGVISDATQFIAGHRHDLVSDGMDRMVAKLDASLKLMSAEDVLFTKYDFDETFIRRRAVATVALELPNATPAEANAKVAMQMLVEGMPLNELRETFSDLSERAFGQLFKDAAVISAEVTATDIFHVRHFDMLEEAATAALTA
jgi:hypothetical protein